MGHPVTWFNIQGPNGESLQTFYSNVFGWKLQPMPGPGGSAMVMPEPPGIAGGIGPSQTGTASVTVYVEVDDLEDAFGKIGDSGGTRVMDPMDLPEGMGRIAGFLDPANNWIGLWAPPDGMTRAEYHAKNAPPPPPAPRAARRAAPKKKAAKKAQKPAKKAAKKPAKKAQKPAKKAKKKGRR